MTGHKPLYMVFDVESIGLHGEGFAVGYVIALLNRGRREGAAWALGGVLGLAPLAGAVPRWGGRGR